MNFTDFPSYPLQRTVLTILFVTGIVCHGLGQDRAGNIMGKIKDSGADRNCAFVVIAILKNDSTLVRFTRTRRDGGWIIRDIREGSYLLLTSHPAYDDYLARIVITRDSTNDLGVLYLRPKSDTLAAAIVTPKSPPLHIRGDTLDYNTTGLKLKANATVEELLKRLPGVTVNQDGSFTINGVRVQRLLVDGEDFFGGDPTIVTKNFNADMIARIQFLDKKSSETEFTGVDDGQRTKTVNLVLKEDSKKGYFVQGEVSGGAQGYDNVNGMLGAFRGPRQFGVLAMTANTGATGFSGEGAGLSIGSGGDALGASAGGGIPQVEGLGAHFANRWNGNVNHISGNSSFGFLVTRPYSSSVSQQILPDRVYMQSQNSRSINSSNQQALDATYDYKPDSLQAYHFSIGGTKTSGKNQFASSGSSSFNDTLVNGSQTAIRSLVTNQQFNGSVMWRMRSRKVKGRYFSMTAGLSNQSNVSSGYVYVLNSFYRPDGGLQNIDTTDQEKIITSSNLNLNGSLNYIEPVWKNTVLAIRYDVNYSRNESEQATYGRAGGKYQDFVDTLGDHYRNGLFSQSTTINLQAMGRPLNYTIGGDIRQFANIQENILADSTLKYNNWTINPRADARYAINQRQSISIDYTASTQQPTIDQLQPIQNNNNPLHITVGNPSLRSSFQQTLGLGFTEANRINFRVGVSFSVTTNSISSRVNTDSLGRQISQPVNVSGSHSGGVNMGVSNRPGNSGIELDLRANLSFGQNAGYVGALLNHNNYFSSGGGISIGKYVADRYAIRLNANATYSSNMSSVNPGFSTSFWTQNHSFEISWFPIAGLEVNTSGSYTWQEKISTFTGNNWNLFWSAYASKNFLQGRMVVKWQINDITGQNSGIGRTISGNTITQTAANTLGRYWVISASYRFVRHGKIK